MRDRDEEMAPLVAYVNAHVGYAWQRKTSFETRATGLITLNLGIATLYFALRNSLSISEGDYQSEPRFLLVAAIALSLLSVGCAAYSAMPVKFLEPDCDLLDTRVSEVNSGLASDLDGEGKSLQTDLIEAAIHQLRIASDANEKKGRFVWLSFLLAAAVVCCMSASLLWGAFGR